MPFQQATQEQPIYELHQRTTRALIPKIASFLVLGILFYVGILLNIALLDLSGTQETTVKTTALLFLLVIIIIGIITAVHRARLSYQFFRDKIRFNKKEIRYTEIINTATKQNILDRMFKTYSIPLSSEFYVRHVSQEVDLKTYLQQLISYSKKSYSSY